MRKSMKFWRKTLTAVTVATTIMLGGCGMQENAEQQTVQESTEQENTEQESMQQEGTEQTESVAVKEGELPGWQLHADDKVTFDWYINYSWFSTPWGENMVSKAITEQTGVDINFMTPMGSESEKLNTMIASGDLPDIITLGWWESQIDEMIGKDMVYALNELADEYEPYFWQVGNDAVVDWYEKEDGNLYFYPNSFYLPEDYERRDDIGANQTFLVRKDIYEAIGSPDMTTQEGFKAAVRKAAEMFPEVGGEPLIPIGAHTFNEQGCTSFDQYLQNFLAVPYEKDGKFYDRYTDPEYISWLKTFRELGSEGYLSRDIFIDQRTQMEEKIAEGRYFCMIYQRTDIEAQQKELYVRNPEQIYMAVDGPKNSKKEDHVLPGTGSNGWTVTLISKNCERPDRAIEFLSYFISEQGQKMTYLGVEGEMYDMVDGKPVLRPEVKNLLNTDRMEYDRIYGANNAYWMLQNNVMQMDWHEELTEPIGQLEEWTYPYTRYRGEYEVILNADTEAGNADLKIKELWSNVLPKLLLAESEEEFDRLLEEFKDERDELGYDIVVEESERQIHEAKERLGL